MTAIKELLSAAEAEVGNLESVANKKYVRDLFGSDTEGLENDLFVDWCFAKAFGRETAKTLLHNYFEPLVMYSADYYRARESYFNQPQIGDVVFFQKMGRVCHTGIIYHVDSEMIYTMEGDTIPGPGVREEGVYKKQHRMSSPDIDGYMRPDWGLLPVDDTYAADYDRNVLIDLKGRYYFSKNQEIGRSWSEASVGV